VSLHLEVLGARQLAVLRRLGPGMASLGLYLGGGTAVALYLGHRRSVDLDWFSAERVADPLALVQALRDEGAAFTTTQVARGTAHGSVSGVRVSLLEYRYALLEPALLWPECGCLIASLPDLACMKLAAVAQRGSKRDFVDVYALAQQYLPLGDLISLYRRKYAVEDAAHLLYSLAYFEDAEPERMPRMHWDVDWREVKATVQQWVRVLAEQ
jgi:hypothetical protein